MLDIISDGFKSAKEKFTGQTTLSEDNVKDAITAIRNSLLEGDVEYSVTKKFLKSVEEKALGQVVALKAGKGDTKQKVSAGDHFVKICQEELEALMGPVDTKLNFASNRPTTVMMVGLQGTGKTTSTGKLTKLLKETQNKNPLLVAADIYRPAAIEQLKVLGKRIGVPVFSKGQEDPVQICKEAIQKAYDDGHDMVIFDTAGRLTIDEDLMTELQNIKKETNPDNILLVCDALMGQDAVTTAKAFHDRLEFDGVIMTKLDGDARGGAALSVKEVTTKPIKFLSMGEDLDSIEEFRPEGLASRILGMGDIVGLMKDFERVAKEDQEEEAMRMLQGKFTFTDFYEQISMIQKMGSLKDVMAKMPMQNMIPEGADVDEKELGRIKAMIDSMTKEERTKPAVFNNSRVQRIAKGSGRATKDVNDLLQKFLQMRKMMGMIGKNMGLLGKIPGMGQLSQMNQMRKMAQSMNSGGGMPAGLSQMFGGGMPGAATNTATKKKVNRDKQKKARKDAKKARKKNRRK